MRTFNWKIRLKMWFATTFLMKSWVPDFIVSHKLMLKFYIRFIRSYMNDVRAFRKETGEMLNKATNSKEAKELLSMDNNLAVLLVLAERSLVQLEYAYEMVYGKK